MPTGDNKRRWALVFFEHAGGRVGHFDPKICVSENNAKYAQKCRDVANKINMIVVEECRISAGNMTEGQTYDKCIADPKILKKVASVTVATEHDIRRLNFVKLTKKPWSHYKILWSAEACGADKPCKATFKASQERLIESCPNICTNNDDHAKCIEDCNAQFENSFAGEKDGAQLAAAQRRMVRIMDGFSPEEADELFSSKFMLPPASILVAAGLSATQVIPQDATAETQSGAVSPPATEPTPVVKKNSLTAHFDAGALMMPGGFNTALIGCRDGTTSCWRWTGPLPLNGAGNPTEIKPAGVIITGGFDYARLVGWRLHVVGGVDGMFAYIPTGSTGEPNNDPAGIMAAGLGGRVGAELRFDRWRVHAVGRVGFNYWTLIGGNGTISLPYIPDVEGEQFSQWSPVAGILAGADIVIRRPIALGLEGGCAWPLADWSQETERFGRDYPNPDVTPDRPSPTMTCGIALRGTYTIKSF